MKNLHVTLKKKWFDMESHPDPKLRKDEEYREIKPYWIKRLMNLVDPDNPQTLESWEFKDFDVYEARHGYATDAPILKRECFEISIGKAKPEWSDNWQGNVFIIKLGDIIQ